MSSSFEAVREAIDTAGADDPAAFARATRNAVAKAILAAAFEPVSPSPPAHNPPPQLFDLVGPDLGHELAALYLGGEDWTTRAIDVLEPLNTVAHGVTWSKS